jgi:uncharacterized protein involved in tolerance to divalent cations
MVNVIIYLERANDAYELANILLVNGLVANASIDEDNISYHLVDNEIVKTINSVVTAQTKSLLFSQIDALINEKYGPNIPIYSLPITQANDTFDNLIRSNTIKT